MRRLYFDSVVRQGTSSLIGLLDDLGSPLRRAVDNDNDLLFEVLQRLVWLSKEPLKRRSFVANRNYN